MNDVLVRTVRGTLTQAALLQNAHLAHLLYITSLVRTNDEMADFVLWD